MVGEGCEPAIRTMRRRLDQTRYQAYQENNADVAYSISTSGATPFSFQCLCVFEDGGCLKKNRGFSFGAYQSGPFTTYWLLWFTR